MTLAIHTRRLIGFGLMTTLALGTQFATATQAQQVNGTQTPPRLAQTVDEFVDVDYQVNGTVELVTLANGDRGLRLSNFVTESGPALEVILYSESAVPSKIKGKGQYESLGVLRADEGTQIYTIPADVDLSTFKTVAIWCEKYDVTFGYAVL